MDPKDPFGFNEPGLDDELRRLISLQPSKTGSTYRVKTDREYPNYIEDLHEDLRTLRSVPGITVGEPTLLTRTERQGAGSIEISEWAIPITKTHGKKVSMGYVGMSHFGEQGPSYWFETERGARATIPTLITPQGLVSPVRNVIEAISAGNIGPEGRQRAKWDLWSILSERALIDYGVTDVSAAEQYTRLLGKAYAFSRDFPEEERLPYAQREGLVYRGGEFATKPYFQMYPQRIAESGELEALIAGSKRNIKAEGPFTGYPSGLSPEYRAPVEQAIFAFPGAEFERGSIFNSLFLMNPAGMSEGIALTDQPMTAIERRLKGLKLTPAQAESLDIGMTFADKGAYWPGGIGSNYEGTMRDLEERIGRRISGVAVVSRGLTKTGPDTYDFDYTQYFMGASLKTSSTKHYLALGSKEALSYRVLGEEEVYRANVVGAIQSSKDIPLLAAQSVAARYRTPEAFRSFWEEQSTRVYERAMGGDPEMLDVFRRASKISPEFAQIYAGLELGTPFEPAKVKEILSRQLIEREGGGLTLAHAGLGEIFSEAAMQNYLDRLRVVERKNVPIGAYDFRLLLEEGLRSANLYQENLSMSELLRTFVEAGLHRQEFRGQTYQMFDPEGVRQIARRTDEAPGFVLSVLRGIASVGPILAPLRPESSAFGTVLSFDYLEQLKQNDRELYDYILEMGRSGKWDNPAQNILLSHFENMMPGILPEERIGVFNPELWNQIRREALSADVAEAQQLEIVARSYNERVGNKAIRINVGGTEHVFPSISDIQRSLVKTEDDDLIRNAAYEMLNMMDVVAGLSGRTEPEAVEEAMGAFESARQAIGEFLLNPEVQKQAFGIVAPTMSTQIIPGQGIDERYIYQNLSYIMQQYGISREEALQLTGMKGEVSPEERLTWAARMPPASNPQLETQIKYVRPIDAPAELYAPGEFEALQNNPRLRHGQSLIGPVTMMAAARDADADILVGTPTRGGRVKTAEELVAQAEIQQESEYRKRRETYAEYWQAQRAGAPIIEKSWMTKAELLKDYWQRFQAQTSIGPLFNITNRLVPSFAHHIARGMGMSAEGLERMSTALGRWGGGPSQMALDMMPVHSGGTETALPNLMSLLKSINIGPGRNYGWHMQRLEETSRLRGGGNLPAVLYGLTQDVLGEVGRSMKAEDYPHFARALAATLMPIESFDSPDFEARRERVANLLINRRPGELLDVDAFLEATGARDLIELFFGATGAPQKAAILPGLLAGASGRNTTRWAARKGETAIDTFLASRELTQAFNVGMERASLSYDIKQGGKAPEEILARMQSAGIEPVFSTQRSSFSAKADQLLASFAAKAGLPAGPGEAGPEDYDFTVSASSLRETAYEAAQSTLASRIGSVQAESDRGTDFHRAFETAFPVGSTTPFGTVLSIEEEFSMLLGTTPEGQRVGLTGQRDYVLETPTGDIFGLDLKTGRAYQSHQLQFGAYGASLENQYGERYKGMIGLYVDEDPQVQSLIKTGRYDEAARLAMEKAAEGIGVVRYPKESLPTRERLMAAAVETYAGVQHAKSIPQGDISGPAPTFGAALRAAGNILGGGGSGGPGDWSGGGGGPRGWGGAGGGGFYNRSDQPLSDLETWTFLKLGRRLSTIEQDLLAGRVSPESYDIESVLKDRETFRALANRLQRNEPYPGSLASLVFGQTEAARAYQSSFFGDFFAGREAAGARFLGLSSKVFDERLDEERFASFLEGKTLIDRGRVGSFSQMPIGELALHAGNRVASRAFPSRREREALSLMQSISGQGDFSEESIKSVTDRFRELAEALKEVRTSTGEYTQLTKEHAQALDQGLRAASILSAYRDELVSEYEGIVKRQPDLISQPEEVMAQMGVRGQHYRALVGTDAEPGLFKTSAVLDIEKLEDLGVARKTGQLLTESQRRSMRAMGAYYGMQAMQRVIGQTIGIQGQEAMAVMPYEQQLASAVGMGPSLLGVMGAQQQNAMIARGYAAYDTFGWALQLGNELYQLPGVANIAQMGRGIYGAWMGSRLWAENMRQLMGEGWESTRLGRFSQALPGLINVAGWTMMGAEAGLQTLNYLGVTQGASVGDFVRTTLGDIGVGLQRMGATGGFIDILARQGQPQIEDISQQMLRAYVAKASAKGYSAAEAATVAGQIASQLGLRYTTTASGPDRAQLIAERAISIGIQPTAYGGALLGAAQTWAPLDTEAQAAMLDNLMGRTVSLSEDEARLRARQQLLTAIQQGKREARAYTRDTLIKGGPLGIMLAYPVGYLAAEIGAKQASEGLSDRAVNELAKQLTGQTRPIGPSEIANVQRFLQSQRGLIGGLQEAYGGTSQELFDRILQMAQATANYDFSQAGLRSFTRGAGLELQMWQQTGMLSGGGMVDMALWAGGLQPYQYTAAQQYMGMIAPYAISPADVLSQMRATFRPGAGAQETANLIQLAQLQQRMGYIPSVSGMGRAIQDWEPWRVSSLADLQQQAAYWGGIGVEEWGMVTEERTRRQRRPITGDAFAALDRQLGLSERGLSAYTYDTVTTTFRRPGMMAGAADLLSGMSQAQLGGIGSMFEMLMANVGPPPESRFTGAAREKFEQRWMADQMQGILRQLTEAYGGLYGRQISSLTGLGQTYQALGLFGEEFNQQFGRASDYIRQYGWLAGESAAGFTRFGWGMGLSQQQSIAYGLQYGQQFQQPYMAQQFQNIVQGLVGLGGEVLPSSQFAAPLIQGSSALDRQRLNQFISGSPLEYSRMLIGQDSFSQQLRRQLEGLGIDLSGLTPMVNPQTGQSMWYQQQLQNQYQSMMMKYMDQYGQIMQGPGGAPMTWQFMRQQEDYLMNRAFTFGGSFSLMGQQYNIPMGQLAIQQALFQLSGEQQEYQFALQERQLDIQRQRFREGIGITAYQQRRQYEWQIEDWEYQEDRAELSFAWRMEDYDEKLRFSRGRERRLLMRQRDRDVISYTMERGHAEDIRGRLEEQRRWQEEALERQKKYYEQDEALARERLQRQREFYQRGRELQQQQMEMQRLQAQLSDQIARRELEHKQMMMQKTFELEQSEWRIKLAQDAANAAMHLFYTQTLPQALSRSKQFTLTTFGEVFSTLQTQAINAIKNILSAIGTTPTTTSGSTNTGTGSTNMSPRSTNYSVGGPVSMVMSEEAAQFNAMIAMGARHYLSGGATAAGPFNRPAGIVHEGEYVVPQQGSLVIRADNQVQVLREILGVLQRIEKKGGPGMVLNMKSSETRRAVNAAMDLYDATYKR